MALRDLTREAVLAAISEHDELGREQFLERYGYRPARAYRLVFRSKYYDPKAVVGVAHRFLAPDREPLRADDFSGGEATVSRILKRLDFQVVREPADGDADDAPPRNPPWIRDELILALALYMTDPASPPGKGSREVLELSGTLNELARAMDRGPGDRFRNANGVYMKMMNFRRFDPTFAAQGKKGLVRGNRLEEEIWQEFANDRARLQQVAAAIRAAVGLGGQTSLADPGDFEDEFQEAPEGRLLTRVHQLRERSKKLVLRKKRHALASHGKLACECCGFDFQARYGERGKGFIEAHHTKPVHTLVEGSKTSIADLALLCSNCHRMVHASRPWLDVDELRALLRAPSISDAKCK